MTKIYTINEASVSVNEMTKGRKYLTDKYKEAKDRFALELCFQKKVMRKDKDLTVIITFYMKELYRKDVDGGVKIVLDACTEAGVFIDDRNITTLVAKKVKSEKDFITIEILEK